MTRLIRACADGRDEAFDSLIELVYDDLRRIAHRTLRGERRGHTLDTTALVHEAYLKLVPQAEASWRDRAHFFAVASRVIRHILIDYARRRNADKRDGGVRVTFREDLARSDPAGVDLLALDEALERLAAHDERLVRIVECRFFGGMTIDETASVLDISPRTVDRGWARARTYLYRDLAAGSRKKEGDEEG
ncbi:MAG: sigma-70 family RNA polymerase sigma factor [Gemmatimonadota bacterium]